MTLLGAASCACTTHACAVMGVTAGSRVSRMRLRFQAVDIWSAVRGDALVRAMCPSPRCVPPSLALRAPPSPACVGACAACREVARARCAAASVRATSARAGRCTFQTPACMSAPLWARACPATPRLPRVPAPGKSSGNKQARARYEHARRALAFSGHRRWACERVKPSLVRPSPSRVHIRARLLSDAAVARPRPQARTWRLRQTAAWPP